jgi:hypothetical protein
MESKLSPACWAIEIVQGSGGWRPTEEAVERSSRQMLILHWLALLMESLKIMSWTAIRMPDCSVFATNGLYGDF